MRRTLKPLASFMRSFHVNGSDFKPSPFSHLSSFNQAMASGSKGHYLSSASLSSLPSDVETQMEYEGDQLYDDRTVMEKEAKLQIALSHLAGDFDRESNLSLQRFFRARYVQVISTGCLKLDMALGIGGLPKGRIVEIYGKEASGKTTLALHTVKEAQKLGGCCVYLDVENAMNHSFAEGMGVNTKDLLIVHPNSAENSLSIVDTLVNCGSIDVIVVDSVAALVPQCELDGVIGIDSHDVQSRLMNQALRKIYSSLSRSQTLVIFVNQVRTNLRSNQGLGQINEVTCGGNALKFHSTIRLRISRRNLLHKEDKITGLGISVQVMKNKLAPSMKTADLDIEFGRGFNSQAEVLEMACNHGIVMREKDGYWIEGTFLENQTDAEQFIAQNNDVAIVLVTALREQLFGISRSDK